MGEDGFMGSGFPDIVLLKTLGCPRCETLRQRLIQESIPFEAKFLDDPEVMADMLSRGEEIVTAAPVLRVKRLNFEDKVFGGPAVTFFRMEDIFYNMDKINISFIQMLRNIIITNSTEALR